MPVRGAGPQIKDENPRHRDYTSFSLPVTTSESTPISGVLKRMLNQLSRPISGMIEMTNSQTLKEH
eukprot:716467-Amphidinium_carterae.1